MRSGASGVACFEASFAVSAMRARECRLYSALFHYWACCERAAPDAPETIDDQRRCTGCRYRTIYGGSRGSASLPAPAAFARENFQTVSGGRSDSSAIWSNIGSSKESVVGEKAFADTTVRIFADPARARSIART